MFRLGVYGSTVTRRVVRWPSSRFGSTERHGALTPGRTEGDPGRYRFSASVRRVR